MKSDFTALYGSVYRSDVVSRLGLVSRPISAILSLGLEGSGLVSVSKVSGLESLDIAKKMVY